jgi:hypothetical protein
MDTSPRVQCGCRSAPLELSDVRRARGDAPSTQQQLKILGINPAVRWNVLDVRRVHWFCVPGWHEDLDGFEPARRAPRPGPKGPTPGGAGGWGNHAHSMGELEEAFPGVWQQGLDLD